MKCSYSRSFFIPQNNVEPLPISNFDGKKTDTAKELDSIIPDSANKPYNIKDLINHLFLATQRFYHLYFDWSLLRK